MWVTLPRTQNTFRSPEVACVMSWTVTHNYNFDVKRVLQVVEVLWMLMKKKVHVRDHPVINKYHRSTTVQVRVS